jgi:hypothetical protein
VARTCVISVLRPVEGQAGVDGAKIGVGDGRRSPRQRSAARHRLVRQCDDIDPHSRKISLVNRIGQTPMSGSGQKHAWRLPGQEGESKTVTGRNRCGAANARSVPKNEIATAIARCAGCLADSVANGESIDCGEGRAINYGGGSMIFFGH